MIENIVPSTYVAPHTPFWICQRIRLYKKLTEGLVHLNLYFVIDTWKQGGALDIFHLMIQFVSISIKINL